MRITRRLGRSVAISLIAVSVPACGNSVQLEFPPNEAVLIASVEAGDGSALAGVTVDITTALVRAFEGCVGRAGTFALVTGEDGSFTTSLNGEPGFGEQMGCVDLVAIPPLASGLLTDSAMNVPIVYRVEAPIDTVRLTLVLRAP